MSKEIKPKIIKKAVRSTLIHRSEAWTLRKRNRLQLNAVKMRFSINTEGKSRKDKIGVLKNL